MPTKRLALTLGTGVGLTAEPARPTNWTPYRVITYLRYAQVSMGGFMPPAMGAL